MATEGTPTRKARRILADDDDDDELPDITHTAFLKLSTPQAIDKKADQESDDEGLFSDDDDDDDEEDSEKEEKVSSRRKRYHHIWVRIDVVCGKKANYPTRISMSIMKNSSTKIFKINEFQSFRNVLYRTYPIQHPQMDGYHYHNSCLTCRCSILNSPKLST
jgi:hypothetical protein